MRIKFEIDIDNNITILSADQEDNTITVKQDGNKKIIFISVPDSAMEDHAKMDMYMPEGEIY